MSLNNINIENSKEKSIENKSLLENLLILLNSAAALGFGPNPEDFSSKGYQIPKASGDEELSRKLQHK